MWIAKNGLHENEMLSAADNHNYVSPMWKRNFKLSSYWQISNLEEITLNFSYSQNPDFF